MAEKTLDMGNTSFYDLPTMSGITETTDRHGQGAVTGPNQFAGPGSAMVRNATWKMGTVPTLNPEDSVDWSAVQHIPPGSASVPEEYTASAAGGVTNNNED